ncbi:MAG TPA: LuxR C-terminal-related transcriptional regulator [Verrucomicrobiae bacterium]|nr:LuxR C-terminal-related transcriptional regulator [Verrucomicrobiae bacterium]
MGKKLTARQRAAVELLAAGFMNKEIADKLGNSEGRVEKLIQGASRRLGLWRRSPITKWWWKIGCKTGRKTSR